MSAWALEALCIVQDNSVETMILGIKDLKAGVQQLRLGLVSLHRVPRINHTIGSRERQALLKGNDEVGCDMTFITALSEILATLSESRFLLKINKIIPKIR